MRYMRYLLLIVTVASAVLPAFPLAAQETHNLDGSASWYAGKFQGRLTANGEVFDTNRLTAAHRTLPFGTLVRVTNPANNRSVVVRINDRGPFIEGRVIDLSRAAAESIGVVAAGVAEVDLEVVHWAAESTTRTIQIAAFSERANAVSLAVRLEQQGFTAMIEDAGGGIHRVILPEVPLETIDTRREELAAIGHGNVLVRSR